MKSFFQRIHDSHAGTRKPADPYPVWEPPKLESERKRHKAGRAEPDYSSTAPKSGEKRRSSRPPDSRHEARTLPSTYNHATFPTTGKTGHLRGHYTTVGNTTSFLPSESNPQIYSHPPVYLPPQNRPSTHEKASATDHPPHQHGYSRYPPLINPALPPEVQSIPSQLPPPRPKPNNVYQERPSEKRNKPREADNSQESGKKRPEERNKDKGDEMERQKFGRERDEDRDKEKTKDRQRKRDRDKDKGGDGGREEIKERDRDRTRDRDRNGDREKGRERDRDREREGGERVGENEEERPKNKYRERERPKEKERAKGREIDKDKDRDRGKDKSRDKEKDHGRERFRNRTRDEGRAYNGHMESMEAKREMEGLERKVRKEREAVEEMERDKELERVKAKEDVRREREKESPGSKTQDKLKERTYKPREADHDRGGERDRTRTYGRDRYNTRLKDTRDGRDLENITEKEGSKDRYSENTRGRESGKVNSTRTENRDSRKPFLEPSKEDGNSSDSSHRIYTQTHHTHRRYRTEEGTASTLMSKKSPQEPPVQSSFPIRQPAAIPNEPENRIDATGAIPYTMPVYNRVKESSQNANMDTPISDKLTVLRPVLSSSDAEAAKGRDTLRSRTLSADTRAAHFLHPSDLDMPGEIHKQQSQGTHHVTKDKIGDTRFKEGKNISSKWQVSHKELSPASQPYSEVVPGSRNDLTEHSVMGPAGRPSPSHFVSIRAGQGPPDPSAHTVSKPAATLHTTIKSPENSDRPDHSAPYPEVADKLDKRNKASEMARSNWQNPLQRAKISDNVISVHPSQHASVSHLPNLMSMPQEHTEGDHSNPPALAQVPSGQALSQRLVTNLDRPPPSMSSREIISGKIPATQPNPIVHNTSLQLSKSPKLSPSKPPLQAVPPPGMQSLPPSERTRLSHAKIPEGAPVSNKGTQQPPTTQVMGLPTHPTTSSRIHQDYGLNMWNTKAIATPQPRLPASVAGLDPSNLPLDSVAKQSEQRIPTQPVSTHSPDKIVKNLSDGPPTVVPHLIAKYEARNVHNISGHPDIPIIQSTPAMPKLALIDKQRQLSSVDLPPALPRSISSQPPQSRIESTGDADRTHASDTAPSGPPVTADQTQSAFGSRNSPNYSRTGYTQKHPAFSPPASYLGGETSVATTATIAPPTSLSLRDILSDPKPSPSTLHNHPAGHPNELPQAKLKGDSRSKLPEVSTEDFRPARSLPSLSLHQPSLRDVSNHAILEKGPAPLFVSEKSERSRLNVPHILGQPYNSMQSSRNESDMNVSSREVGSFQRQSLEQVTDSARASIRQLPSSSTGDSKADHEYSKYLDNHRLMPPTISSVAYQGSGSRREGKDAAPQLHEQTLSQTIHLTTPAQIYRPPIQHSVLAEILSSPTPPAKHISHATSADVQRRKPTPSKNSYDLLSSKLQQQTSSPEPPTPSLTPKSRESPQSTSGGLQHTASRDDIPIFPTAANQMYHSTSRRHPSPVSREGTQYMSQPRASSRASEALKPAPITQTSTTIATSQPHRSQPPTTVTPMSDTGNHWPEAAGTSTMLHPGIPMVTSSMGHAVQSQKSSSSAVIRTPATHPIPSSVDRSQPVKRYETPQKPPSRNRGAASGQPSKHTLPDPIPPQSLAVQNPSQAPSTRHDQITSLSSTLPAAQPHNTPTMAPLASSHPPRISEIRTPSEASILKTPSSLAPSMLRPTVSRTSIPTSIASQDSRKKGLFSMFRSKPQPPSQTYEVWRPPDATQKPESKQNGRKAEFPQKSVVETDPTSSKGKAPDPDPASRPVPIASGRKSPNSKVFTPFRYLTSKRNRTMSAASVEAQDGTAPNTVVGSPTASMHSQNPMQPPPFRDPLVATREWRKLEAAEVRARGNGKVRRQRPGVVFDVAEDPSEDKRNKPMRSRTYAGSRSS